MISDFGWRISDQQNFVDVEPTSTYFQSFIKDLCPKGVALKGRL
jgi:hypothetical protein